MPGFENMKLNHEIDGAAKVQFDFCRVSPLSTSRCRHASKLATCCSYDFPYSSSI